MKNNIFRVYTIVVAFCLFIVMIVLTNDSVNELIDTRTYKPLIVIALMLTISITLYKVRRSNG